MISDSKITALLLSFVLMSEANVLFFTEDVNFTFQHAVVVKQWLYYIANHENDAINHANVIFCSNDYILDVNKSYLSHDYYTDIITFPLMDVGTPIEADIFISIDTVRSNAADRSISFEHELFRVIVHGFLHMLGYGDKSESEAKVMRQKEDFYLDYFFAEIYC